MNPIDLFPMFLLGFFGTGHCLGMCGPLVFAFPGRTGRGSAHLGYHLGRITTYTVVGAVMGAATSVVRSIAGLSGQETLHVVNTAQMGISVLAAGAMCIFGLQRLGILSEPQWMAAASPSRIPGWKRLLRSARTHHLFRAHYFLGLVLGFIPCGLSYAAFSRALVSDSIFSGAVMLFVFGLGTLPGLLLLGTGAAVVVRRYARLSDIISGLLLVGMAAMLISDAAGALMK